MRGLKPEHLEGRTSAFFCYGDGGGDELDATGRPKILQHKTYFDPSEEPFEDMRQAYAPLVWQCRYGGVEVPDSLWAYYEFGKGKKYSDNQAEDMIREKDVLETFDRWERSRLDTPECRFFYQMTLAQLNGRSWGDWEARCQVSIGRGATLEDLNRDWVLTHEMFHFAFPSVPEHNRWIEEGLSTYAEPIARAGIGIVKPEQVWNEMVRDMPKGLPVSGDRSLDLTHTWGRTYWGGALFWLYADVGLLRVTENRFGVRDALAVNLPELWKQLGVHRLGDRITYDDHAPLAAIRVGILGS